MVAKQGAHGHFSWCGLEAADNVLHPMQGPRRGSPTRKQLEEAYVAADFVAEGTEPTPDLKVHKLATTDL